jgi:acetyltransferase
MSEQDLKDGIAARPYPQELVSPFRLKNQVEVIIRPIRPDDEPLLARFHELLSERSVYFRYFHMIGLGQRIDHARLSHICHIDYDTEMVLVAEYLDPAAQQPAILAVGRLNRLTDPREAEFAVLVGDRWQGQGLGVELLRRLIDYARTSGLARVVGEIHPENLVMQKVCQKMGFKRRYSIEDNLVYVSLEL